MNDTPVHICVANTPEGVKHYVTLLPPEDIIGVLEATDGKVVPGSCRPCPKQMILAPDGFFQLATTLHECLLRELQSRMS